MRVCILGTVIGEPRHLLHDTEIGSYKWVNDPPPDAWVLGDSDAELSIDQLCRISGRQIEMTPTPNQARALEVLRSTDPNISVRWRYILPQAQFNAFIKRLLDDARDAVVEGNSAYYIDIFRKTSSFLGSLEPARIDEAKLYAYYEAEKNATNRSTLKSFFSDSSGFAQKVKYHQAATVTGRLTVASGPRILTLDKHKRDIITSSWPDGKVMILDYRSMEPRLALEQVGRPTPEDIYNDINHQLFGDDLEYDRIKVMSISLLYGAQEETFRKLSGLQPDAARDAMEHLGSYFGVRSIRAKLAAEFKANGFIKNRYGRVIRPKKDAPRLLYNYFIQSTAVDAALLGFAGAIDLCKAEKWSIRPLFVIHDALLLDVAPGADIYLDRILDRCADINGFACEFPVRVENVS